MNIKSMRLRSYRSFAVDEHVSPEAAERYRTLKAYERLRVAGCSEAVALEQLGMSRRTLYRWQAGLNRSMLGTGLGDLGRRIEQKALAVERCNPAYTSQTCSDCGVVSAESRRSQAVFLCVGCGAEKNADVNAAINIMASGTGASGRRGALTLVTPMTRQMDMDSFWELCI